MFQHKAIETSNNSEQGKLHPCSFNDIAVFSKLSEKYKFREFIYQGREKILLGEVHQEAQQEYWQTIQ